MKHTPILSLLALIALALLLPACQPGAENAQADQLTIDYEKYTLDNGMDVILHQDDSDPIVAVAIVYHVGSNREKPRRTGFAHFFEHMLFQNSENVGKGNFFKKIEEMGGTLNGGTNFDQTVYYEVVPKGGLERVLWMEADRMGYMINTVTLPVLENEKQVVKNEKRQRVDNVPYGHTNYVINKALYPEDHPYNWQVIGSLADLEAATLNDVREFYDQWYGPNNATMVIAGDFDFAQAREWIEKYFGEIPARGEDEPMPAMVPELTENQFLMHEDNFANLPEMRMVWPTVEAGHPDVYALDFLAELLSEGKRAPLYQDLVENLKIAPSPLAFHSNLELSGAFTINVRTNAGVDLDEAYQGVQDALARFEREGIDDRDMERIKNRLETGFYLGISSVLNKSFQLGYFNEFRGSPDELMAEAEKIKAVTKADVQRVYETYIQDRPFIATSFVPRGKPQLAIEGSQTAAVVEEAIVQGAEAPPMVETEDNFQRTPSGIDRSQEPALVDAPASIAPDVWTAQLDNGLSLYGIENTELPLVTFSFRIKGGLLLDDPEKVGVANLITDVMMEGTQNKTPQELQDAIGRLGASISMYTSDEFIGLRGSCLARNYEAVTDLAREILLEPRWDEQEFERLKQQTITNIISRESQPNAIASRVFSKLIYGPGNMLSNNTLGSRESVQAITLEDLKAYYAKNFTPTLTSYHISGAIPKDRAIQALRDLEDQWEAREVTLPEMPQAEPIDQPVLYMVDIPAAKQSIVQVGMPAPGAGDPDFYAATVANYPLGGNFSSQLNMTLREEKGYTYGAGSGFTPRITGGYFQANSSVRTNVTRESVEIFRDLIGNYRESLTEADIDRTKSILIKRNARAFETINQKLGILEDISTFGLPEDYMIQREQEVRNLDLDRFRDLIDRYMNPEKMIYLVVGDAKTQAERLKEVGLGDPIMLDRDGVPVKAIPN